MDRNEFERRRRALEEMYQADLNLVRAAHAARVRSLEALWLAPPEETAPSTAQAGAPPVPPLSPISETTPARVEAPRTVPQAPPPTARPRNPYLRGALEGCYADLPVVFDQKDVIRALGWTPSRTSLQRLLHQLTYQKVLAMESQSFGRKLTRFRKVMEVLPPEE